MNDLRRCPICQVEVIPPVNATGEERLRAGEVSGLEAYGICPECGVLGLDPLPEATVAAKWYGAEYFTSRGGGGYVDYLGDEAIHRRNARRHLRRLRRLGVDAGRLVELGCAAGFLLDEARKAGWEPAGVDVSGPMLDVARQRFGLEVASDLHLLDLEAESVDALVAVQILEHATDPFELLVESLKLLKPGATVLIETWDINTMVAKLAGPRWQQISPPSVIWIWNRAQLRRLLTAAGFRDIRISRGFKWVSLRTVLGVLGQNRPAALPVAALPVPYALGDLVIVTARV